MSDSMTPTKAFAAGLAAAVMGAVVEYFTAGNDLNWHTLLAAVGSAAVAFVTTYLAPRNQVKATTVERRNDVGAGVLTVVVGVVIGILLIWLVLALVSHRDHNGGHGNDWERPPIGVLA